MDSLEIPVRTVAAHNTPHHTGMMDAVVLVLPVGTMSVRGYVER